MQNDIVVILGQKGMGKTTLAFELMKGKRFIFLDVRRSFEPSEIFAVDAILVKPQTSEQVQDTLLTFLNGGKSIVVQAAIEVNEIFLEMIAVLTIDGRHLNFWVVVDEANFYMTSHEIHPAIKTIIAVGRHSELNQIYIARDYSELHPYVRSQADRITSFRQREPNQLKYASQLTEHWETLKDLPKYKYVDLREKPLDN